MPEESTELLKESRLRGALPDGFKSTLIEEDRLRQLDNQSTSNLENVVADYGNYKLRERDIVRGHVQRSLTAFVTPERTMELPATGLELDRIEAFAAYYKQDNETPSGIVKDPKRAGPDDIVFSFANPEVYEEISGQAQDTFEQTGLTGGNTLDVVGDAGVDEATNVNTNVLELDDNEMMYFTGDYIDLSEGKSVISKIQWTDIDGESFGPDDGLFETRLSGAHVLTAQGAFIKSTADLDAKIYADGDAEFVPVAYYMGPGTNAPSLV